MEKIYEAQRQITETIEREYQQGNYTFDKPYVKRDPYGLTPLAAMVRFPMEQVTHFEVTVAEDYTYTLAANALEQELVIVGLYGGCTNQVEIKAKKNDVVVGSVQLVIETQPLPAEYDYLEVVQSQKDKVSEGWMTLCLARADGSRPFGNLYSIMDYDGQIRWYYLGKSWYLFKKLKNGRLVVDSPVSEGEYEKYSPTGVVEMDYLGRYYDFYEMPNGSHHDICEMPNGNILALTQHAHTVEDVVVEFDRKTRQIIDVIDFNEILDPLRPAVIDKKVINDERDWLHLNSVSYDERDGGIVVSSRNQSLVVKIDKATRAIKWILGPHENWAESYKQYLLQPVGGDFEWSWSGHTAIIHGDNILLFDNGNYRSFDFEKATLAGSNYSRGVEYHLDLERQEVSQVWQYGKQRGHELHCPFLSGISLLENNNRLMCFGGTAKDRFGNAVDDMKSPRVKNRVYIVETTGDQEAEVVFEARFIDRDVMTSGGFLCYRAGKIRMFE
ncbi:MAG: aryl-sulfate sulfotransferase [Cellulosilyticaceae bacterium]